MVLQIGFYKDRSTLFLQVSRISEFFFKNNLEKGNVIYPVFIKCPIYFKTGVIKKDVGYTSNCFKLKIDGNFK